MALRAPPASHSSSVASAVREKIQRGGERVWRLEDFAELPFLAVAQAFSRLTKEGMLKRLSKGIYYRSRKTAFGESRPNPANLQRLAERRASIFPSGLSAAGLFGLTTQSGRRGEVATSGLSLPRKLLGEETIIRTRRPEAWKRLSSADAALLDLLRTRGEASELPPEETAARITELVAEGARFERLLKASATEPPRVRAMLGAIGEHLHKPDRQLDRLRKSLNPYSRFDFGALRSLPTASHWQAK